MFGFFSTKVAIVLMQKNEGRILPAWLDYYRRLIGLRHIHLIDNGSDDPAAMALLEKAALKGVHVTYQPGREVFERKGEIVQALAASLTDYDVVLPLDADEFLAVMVGDQPDWRPWVVRREIRRFARSAQPLGLIRNAFVNIPGTALVQHQPCRKVVIRPTTTRPLTKGYHFPPNFTGGLETSLCHIHYHRRGSVEEMRRSAIDKLPDRPIRDLVSYRGKGHHMKHFLTMSEADYRRRFAQEQGLDVSRMFRSIGHKVPYGDWQETGTDAARTPTSLAVDGSKGALR